MPPTTQQVVSMGYSSVDVTVTATQSDGVPETTIVEIVPPPVVTIHGIWSNGDAWAPFSSWLSSRYPHQIIVNVDYRRTSMKSFTDTANQAALGRGIQQALVQAALAGIAARQVDVVAHSMGGLVTRHFINGRPTTPVYFNPVHQLITVGTPHHGTPLANVFLSNRKNQTTNTLAGALVRRFCSNNKPAPIVPCTLEMVFAAQNKQVDSAVQSLASGLSDDNNSRYSSIVGQVPPIALPSWH